MNWKKLSPTLALLAGLSAVLLGGCGSDYNRISSIVDDPNRFLNHDVKVAGEVTQVYELPLGITNLAAYRVNDGSGQIWVISHAGAPVKGDRVGIKGRVETMTSLRLPVVGDILGDVIDEHSRQLR